MGPTCLRMSSFIFFHDMTKQPPKSAGEEDTKPEEGLSSSLFYVPNQSFHVEDSVRLDLLFLGLAPSTAREIRWCPENEGEQAQGRILLSPAAKLNELCSFVANMTEQKRVVGRRNGERPPHEKEAVDRERCVRVRVVHEGKCFKRSQERKRESKGGRERRTLTRSHTGVDLLGFLIVVDVGESLREEGKLRQV